MRRSPHTILAPTHLTALPAVAAFPYLAFKGELQTLWATRPEAQIDDPPIFPVCQLNGEGAAGRLDKLEQRDIETELGESGTVTVSRYEVRRPALKDSSSEATVATDPMTTAGSDA